MLLLMLHGGLRPEEVLNLHLEDVQYGRRRVIVRYRTNHPKGARTKSQQERVVDLHEPEALAAMSTYVMEERPREADSTLIFLVGGRGAKRGEPLSYAALAKLFARCCERVGIHDSWVTLHTLLHTYATRMWEGEMRELDLMRRLGYAPPVGELTKQNLLLVLLLFFRDIAAWGWDDAPDRPLLGRGDIPTMPTCVPRYIPADELLR